ncbi:MAG: glycosyltransferase family 39 protein [Acidobacteriia bacterium]|nr:glycosyltransferase family 39 protein [Terriglobia bacterium]
MSTKTKSRRTPRSKAEAAVTERTDPSQESAKSVGSSTGTPHPKRHRHVHLFILICLVYLCTLTDRAFDWIGDGQVMFDTAVSLHEFGELGISTEAVQDLSEGGGTTDYYGKYGLGFSVVEQVPLMLVTPVEKLFGEGRSNVLFPMMNMLLTALTALLVALCLQEMGFRSRTQWWAALGFAFATPAWPYVSYDFSEPLQALCLIAAFWFSLRVKEARQPSFLYPALVGFALGFAVLSKQQLVILIPAYALYLWMCLVGGRKQRQRSFGWFMITLGIWGVAIAALNHHRFGSIFASGYGDIGMKFSTPILTGLYGLLIGPNKGIVFYAPLTVLVPWSLWKMRRQYRIELAYFASVFALHILLISKWYSWEGGASWGPRLLMSVIPLMVVCAAMLLDSVRWSFHAFVGCVAAGIIINLLGVSMNFLVWLNAVDTNRIRLPLETRGRPTREYIEHDGKRWFRPYLATNFVPVLSPILGHAWLLRLRYRGIPFRLNGTNDGSTPMVSYPPIEINLGLIKDPFFQSHLRSPHFWLYETVTHQPREEIFTYPVYGISIERQGDRAVAKGDGERAVECYARAAELVPNYASPALKLSRLQVERGRVGEGVETLRRYLSRGDRNQDQERAVRLQLARIYEKAGYREAALDQFQSYLTLQPSEENRTAIERHMAELTGVHR